MSDASSSTTALQTFTVDDAKAVVDEVRKIRKLYIIGANIPGLFALGAALTGLIAPEAFWPPVVVTVVLSVASPMVARRLLLSGCKSRGLSETQSQAIAEVAKERLLNPDDDATYTLTRDMAQTAQSVGR